MRDRIILSEAGSYYQEVVKKRLRLSGQDDYIPMRIALGRSFQVKTEPLITSSIEGKSTKKKSVLLTSFEQNQRLLFQALLSQRYKRKVEDDEYIDLLTQHIEHGLWIIANDTEKLQGYDYLVTVTSDKKLRPTFEDALSTFSPTDIHPSILSARIGKVKETQKDVVYSINTANNPHIAVMGAPGSGKTYFLKHLLKELRRNSKFETHFIIFDYKDGDIAKDKEFVQATKAEVIDLKKRPLPMNIFADVGKNTREQRARAERVVELVKNVEANIGKVQEDNLYNAIINAFNRLNLNFANEALEEVLDGQNVQSSSEVEFPDFRMIREELERINPRPDSLTSVLRPLVELNYFAERNQDIYKTWTNRTVVIDLHEIERKELVCFLVLNQIHKELKKLGPTQVDAITKARKTRIIIVIDEAHYFLANKKRSKVLAEMIRDVRSSGGAVVLASQSPDDYDKDEFDYLELIEFPIVLKSTPSSHHFLQQKFSLSSFEAKELLKKIGRLGKGEGYLIYKNEVKLVELCK